MCISDNEMDGEEAETPIKVCLVCADPSTALKLFIHSIPSFEATCKEGESHEEFRKAESQIKGRIQNLVYVSPAPPPRVLPHDIGISLKLHSITLYPSFHPITVH